MASKKTEYKISHEVSTETRNSLECCYLTEDTFKEVVITKVAFFLLSFLKNTCGRDGTLFTGSYFRFQNEALGARRNRTEVKRISIAVYLYVQ